MNTNEFDYYLIERDNKFMSPLLINDDEINSGGTMFLRRFQRVDEKTIVHLVFNPPIPPKPEMTDRPCRVTGWNIADTCDHRCPMGR